MNLKIAATLTLLLAAFPLRATAANPSHLMLLKSAAVHGEVVSLADLLPANAPEGIRTSAAGILLCSAPRIGSQRTLGRTEIERAIRTTPALDSAFDIPASVIVTRWSRPVSKDEVSDAINKSTAASGFADADSLSPEDVTFDSPIAVTEENPTLTVTRFEPNIRAGGTHVALWVESEPRTPPFWVTLDREIDEPAGPPPQTTPQPLSATSPNFRQTVRRTQIAPRAAPQDRASEDAPLVHVGTSLELVVQGSGMRITAKATALETGREGQNIRVQCEPAGKIVVARLTGAQTAEIDY
jgi:hypothetical protein